MENKRNLKLAAVTPNVEEDRAPARGTDKVSLSLVVPVDLHHRVRMESWMREQTVGEIIEEMVDQNVSPEPVTLTVDDLMNLTENDDPVIPGAETKGLSAPISRRHHALIRLEAMRRKLSIRGLVRLWLREHVRDWIIEPVDPQRGAHPPEPMAAAS